ncbi:hypothetical protein ThesiDRAFT1_0441 [Thermoanaerobacter siderophilus SR4]|uniref:Uncharacterized protein n=1 Tax=Thermoanaerobacter siderophilus SR4 TaxID=880478 RepID=I9KRQ8_9THEO|nr:hypothetical protein ThesiDRAFT1_0441 [Thermoanaerobacter siderophilus SR4]
MLYKKNILTFVKLRYTIILKASASDCNTVAIGRF